MLAQFSLREEALRYSVIAEGPCIERPAGWFAPDKYVVVNIVDEYFSGRIIEVTGKNPPTLKLCMFQGRNACETGMESCLRGCPKRLLTSADNGAVLTDDDIISGVLGYPDYGFIDPDKAEEIFCLIEKLEKRQSLWRQI